MLVLSINFSAFIESLICEDNNVSLLGSACTTSKFLY